MTTLTPERLAEIQRIAEQLPTLNFDSVRDRETIQECCNTIRSLLAALAEAQQQIATIREILVRIHDMAEHDISYFELEGTSNLPQIAVDAWDALRMLEVKCHD